MIEPTLELRHLLEAHGLQCTIEDEWVIPNSELPAIRALWHPGKNSGRLDIHVLMEHGILIEECFAGIGSGKQGFTDALHNFMINSLHVFLAAFWGKNDPEQVTTETWNISGRSFIAYMGNFGTRGSEGVRASIPDELFGSIVAAVQEEKLSGMTHWVRTFFCNVADNQTFEALLDNDDWPRGLNRLKEISWEKSSGYYSIRNFILLQAA